MIYDRGSSIKNVRYSASIVQPVCVARINLNYHYSVRYLVLLNILLGTNLNYRCQ